jgi:predicted transcriptional regulator
MSQQEITKLLERNPNGLSSREISNILEINMSSVSRCVKRLLKFQEIEAKVQITKKNKYKIKRTD